ncbi:hypothetical protein BKA65DRAFT_474157 [Rhexocercosporidium sp. MPI-PUGE-AT-0058]|nr:hypothetical protein BKA65DRAFT_474157 [Rhexocercosporidium sp. MPI-PUGE-AT-0058]
MTIMMKINILVALLTFLSLAACAPAVTNQDLDSAFTSGFTNHTTEIASGLSSRDTWRPGQYRSVELEPGLKFQICCPNPDDANMCYVSFVEKSTWGAWAVMWVYDNMCNQLGYSEHVARN